MTAEEDDFIAGVEAIVNRINDNISVMFPGTIIAPSSKEGLVDVQPNIKIKFIGSDEEVEPKAINNVILHYPARTGSTIIRPPRESLIGSKVMVHISEHSLTEWRSSGGKSIFPDESRRFNLNDAVAVLGMYSETVRWPNAQLPNTFDFLGLEGTKFQIGTQTSDLLDILFKINQALITSGVLPGGTVTALTAQQDLLTTITNIKT